MRKIHILHLGREKQWEKCDVEDNLAKLFPTQILSSTIQFVKKA